jgi:hypothetical protein
VRERELPPRAPPGDLALAGLAAQLRARLEGMRRPEAPIGWPERFQAAVRVDRELAVEIEVPARTSSGVPRRTPGFLSTSSVGVKQSWTSAIASSCCGS